MLEEAIDVMRLLWEGDLCSFEGKHYRVDDARLYTLPDEPIPIVVAAGGVEAAKLAARKGDGLVSTAPDAEIVSSYRDAGGSGATYGMLTVCWAASEEEARATALEWWPNAALKGPLGQELPLPSHFEDAAAMVDEGSIAEAIVCGPHARPTCPGFASSPRPASITCTSIRSGPIRTDSWTSTSVRCLARLSVSTWLPETRP